MCEIIGGVSVDQGGCGAWHVNSTMLMQIPMATPFVINIAQLEYCRGEFDEEKKLYGVRVHFASGHTLFCAGEEGLRFLEMLEKVVPIHRDSKTKRSLVEKLREKLRC